MINMDNQQKYLVISRLQKNKTPKDIADELDISYGAVLKLRREFDEAQTNNTVNKLIDMDDVILDEVANKLSNLPGSEEAIDELNTKLKGLEHLGFELQNTALQINTRVRTMIMGAENVSELEVITDILCKLQTSFLNKNLTQVNVQNNYPGDDRPKYDQFLGDNPID
jgi:hypothetical protein